jgi:hypothetical protein
MSHDHRAEKSSEKRYGSCLSIWQGLPLLILDLAVPRAVEASTRDVPGVQVIDMDVLGHLCPIEGLQRSAAVQRGEALALQETLRITRWVRVRAMTPAIVELRRQGEEIRAFVLRRVRPADDSRLDHRAVYDRLSGGSRTHEQYGAWQHEGKQLQRASHERGMIRRQPPRVLLCAIEDDNACSRRQERLHCIPGNRAGTEHDSGRFLRPSRDGTALTESKRDCGNWY